MPALRLLPAAALLALGAGCGGSPALRVTSPDVARGALLSDRYTCVGDDQPLTVRWSGGPKRPAGWAVVVEDADGPRGTETLWLVTGIGPTVHEVGATLPAGAVASLTTRSKPGWSGACPAAGAVHRVVVRVHALRAPLALAATTSPTDGRRAVEAATTAIGELDVRASGS